LHCFIFLTGDGRIPHNVLNRFVGAGEYQEALDYFGFEGNYSTKWGNDGWYNKKKMKSIILKVLLLVLMI